MAVDLSSSKDQLREVKELLLRLVNPLQQPPIPPACPKSTSTANVANPPASQITRGPRNSSNDDPLVHLHNPTAARTVNPSAFVTGAPVDAVRVHKGASPSWASGETIPVTPNTLLQNFRNTMPIGAAVSTDVSASIGTGSGDHSPSPLNDITPRSSREHNVTTLTPTSPSARTGQQSSDIISTVDGVSTRAMSSDPIPVRRPPRMRFEVILLPQITSDAIAVNTLVYILHPQCGSTVVAEGKAGGSWKSRKSKFGSLCSNGQQMVQVHKIIVPNLRLMYVEDRQPMTTMDQALVKSSGSSVYVKWDTKLLHKKTKVPGHTGDGAGRS